MLQKVKYMSALAWRIGTVLTAGILSSGKKSELLGYNAVMLVISNENMDIDTKLEVIQMMIDRGIDINWVNCYAETALNIALSRIEPRIAKPLMDNGCVLTISEPTRQ